MAVLRKAKQTTVGMRDYASAMLRAWRSVAPTLPSKESVAVLWAQYMIETGGRSCFNWNIGNVKHIDGDGHDWIELHDVWEGESPSIARELIARGFAVLDTNEDHIKAVGPGRVAIVFQPPHPATRFRAYETLAEAMTSHLAFLKRRYAAAWSEVEKGDYRGFAKKLKEGRDGKENTSDDYFTAAYEAYAKGMSYPFAMFIGSKVYDEERSTLLSSMDVPTIVPPPPLIPEFDQPIVHPDVPMPPRCPRCHLMSCNGTCPLV
jgi:hypothetical protein